MNRADSTRRVLVVLMTSVLTVTLLAFASTPAASAAPSAGTDPGPAQRYTVSAAVRLPFLPTDVATESETRMLYVIGQDPVTGSGRLRAQSQTNPAVATKDVSLPGTLAGLAVDAPYHRIFITDRVDNLVYVIDTRTLAMITRVAVGLYPYDVQVDPLRHRAFVSNYDSKTVSVIDVPTARVIATIPVAANPGAIAIDAHRGQVFVLNTVGFDLLFGSDISVLAEPSLRVVGTIALDQLWIGDLAVDLLRQQIIAPSIGGLLVIDECSRRIVSQLPVDISLTHIAVDSHAHVAYLTSQDGFFPNEPGPTPQTVSAVSETTGAVLGTMQVGTQSNFTSSVIDHAGIAVEPLTGVAFSVSTAVSSDISIPAVTGTIATIAHGPAALTPAKTHMSLTSGRSILQPESSGIRTFYATVSPPPDGGTVSVFLNGVRVPFQQDQVINPATGVVAFEDYFTHRGTYTMKAVFSGDAQYRAVATSITFTIADPYCGTPSGPVPCS